jgi:hypothetical protein
MEPTQLVWNDEGRSLSLGRTCEEAQQMDAFQTQDRIKSTMRQYVAEHPECTYEAIMSAVRGKTTTRKQVHQSLLDAGMLVRSGGGAKGDPYKYQVVDVPYKEAFQA